MKKVALTILTSIIFFSGLRAQLGRSLQPSWIHLDKPFYVTEDPLGFQLYLANEFSGLEIAVQSILFDATGDPVLYAYWNTNGRNILNGNLYIPSDLPTAWYYLSFRVWDEDRKTERVLQQAPIAIYNDQQEVAPEEISQQEPGRQTALVIVPEKELQIEIVNTPTTLEVGAPIQLDLKITDRRGKPVKANYSVSVNDWSLMSTALAMGMDNLQSSDSLRVITPDHLYKQVFWQGVLLNQEGAPLAGQNVIAISSNQQQLLSTSPQGRFVFLPSSSTNELKFQSSNGEAANIKFQPARGRLALGQLFYSPAAFRYLETNKQRKLLFDLIASKPFTEAWANQNKVAPYSGQFTLNTLSDGRFSNWSREESNTQLPSNTTIVWQAGLQTNEDGLGSVTYHHGWEKAVYRVDIVAQDDKGRRGRKTISYRVINP